jgi:hypothetical protein
LQLHEIKHIVRFIVAFGGSRDYQVSCPEEHHKAHVKRPSRRSQKNLKTITTINSMLTSRPSGRVTEVQCRMRRPSQLMAVPCRSLIAILLKGPPEPLGQTPYIFDITKYHLSAMPGTSYVHLL